MSPAVFIPPTVEDVPRYLPDSTPMQKRLMRHYSPLPRGRSVLLVEGHYVTRDTPDTTGLVEGIDLFLGGHVYNVSDAVAVALIADGYSMAPVAATGLRLPGLDTDYISTPDSVANSLGRKTFDLKVKVTLDDVTPATGQSLIHKAVDGTSGITWVWRLSAGGDTVVVFVSNNGTSLGSRQISGVSVDQGVPIWFRLSRDNSEQLWLGLSEDNIEWSELTQPAPTSGTGNLFDSSGPLAIGRGVSANTAPLAGIVHRAEVYDARDGNLVHLFDPTQVMTTGSRVPDSVADGGPWTIHGDAWEWVTA